MFGFKKKNDLEVEMENYQKGSESNYTSYDISADFNLVIEDVFTITGRGTIIVGQIESGVISVNDTVKILDNNGNLKKTATVKGIEMFRKVLNTAKAGDSVGILLENVCRTDVMKGYMLAK